MSNHYHFLLKIYH